MSAATVDAVADLLRQFRAAYGDDPEALATLDGLARRLEEPLRVAIAGMVKAGKSTLLNAIIGEEIAPTDTGECTRIVTWYRYGDTPRITLHPIDGEHRTLPIKRTRGRLVFDLDGTRAEDVARLSVEWPAKALRTVTLIDTPGIASLSEQVSARSMAFLTPENASSEADAVVYVMRHLHSVDLSFLDAFRSSGVGGSGLANALAVLSRVDEIGAGRIDSLISAQDIAARYQHDESLRSLVLGVAPVAGLVAQGARTLRQAEYRALVELARLDRDERERLMVSADRFVRPVDGVTTSAQTRAGLLSRFGLFGIRLAVVLIRGGVTDSSELAQELARRSGLDDVLRLIRGQLEARGEHLKARTALSAVQQLLGSRPRPGTEQLAASLERIEASAHEFRELRLLTEARTTGLPLPPAVVSEAERLIGGEGFEATERLGLDESAPEVEVRAAALAALQRWRTLAENPFHDRAAVDVCQLIVRSCEALLLPTEGGLGTDAATARARTEPPAGSWQETDYQAQRRQ
ncbi:dynamin family protein [Salinibacterium sp. ZJ450]|uniref:dynamin family protein n=1 Tax=Salinibacterium sp. ZJ450 TaxID=2708338 RepID=UPI0014247A15|nr:dynamin family protein [Salinibacterium sp. ZJ450]